MVILPSLELGLSVTHPVVTRSTQEEYAYSGITQPFKEIPLVIGRFTRFASPASVRAMDSQRRSRKRRSGASGVSVSAQRNLDPCRRQHHVEAGHQNRTSHRHLPDSEPDPQSL